MLKAEVTGNVSTGGMVLTFADGKRVAVQAQSEEIAPVVHAAVAIESRRWDRGTVYTQTPHGYARVRLRPGMHFQYAEETVEDQSRCFTYRVVDFEVVATSSEGEVVLRPHDESRTEADELFPEEVFVRGYRARCPFKRVDEKMARADKTRLKVGDFLAHEAWDCWLRLSLSTAVTGASDAAR